MSICNQWSFENSFSLMLWIKLFGC